MQIETLLEQTRNAIQTRIKNVERKAKEARNLIRYNAPYLRQLECELGDLQAVLWTLQNLDRVTANISCLRSYPECQDLIRVALPRTS